MQDLALAGRPNKDARNETMRARGGRSISGRIHDQMVAFPPGKIMDAYGIGNWKAGTRCRGIDIYSRTARNSVLASTKIQINRRFISLASYCAIRSNPLRSSCNFSEASGSMSLYKWRGDFRLTMRKF